MASQIKGHVLCVLLDDSLNSSHSRLQCLHSRPVRYADEVMAGTVKQVASLRRIEVEEYARYNCTYVSIPDHKPVYE